MTGYEFIFSGKPVKRLYRHIFFWLVLAMHFIIQNLMIGGFNEGLRHRSFSESAFKAIFFFPFYFISVYIFIYGLLPHYFFPRRYGLFLFWIAVLIGGNFIAASLSGALYMHVAWQMPLDAITFNDDKYNAVVNGIFFPISILGITGGIKLAKKWYLEQNENNRLAKEKITHELQLLKTQLHPRFLFHSLHTIKKNILLQPTLAASLILQLSDLLSYILYESDRTWVLLDKELEIIKSYVELQRKSMGSKLTIEMNVSGVTQAKYIFPLLLLSFIENIFNLFLKENQKKLTLKLNVTVSDTRLDFYLICSDFLHKLPDPLEINQQFFNLEKQLYFIYPTAPPLTIESGEENMTIAIHLPLNINISKKEIAVQNEIHEFL
ncbi:MAG: histidine kinase [Bacteroidota bacterium]|nr:histidine kinase [Bacteroidota bacterium]